MPDYRVHNEAGCIKKFDTTVADIKSEVVIMLKRLEKYKKNWQQKPNWAFAELSDIKEDLKGINNILEHYK
jgi:hypothetical protein